jgi:hypothetical protein
VAKRYHTRCYSPVNRDSVCIDVMRYDLESGTSEHMNADGSWSSFEGFDVFPSPTVEIAGIEFRRMFGRNVSPEEDVANLVQELIRKATV